MRDKIEQNYKSKISHVVDDLVSGQGVKDISDMIKFGDTIVVGLSGGADSVALTHFLKSLSEYFKLKIIACHINHGLRGAEADADQEFVRLYCKKLGIELLEKKLDLLEIRKNTKKSLEELGRIYRYEFFHECSEKYGAKIATAHNMNDNVETVILNLIRGSGLRGMCGIPKIRGNIIRPLINFSREDIENYCEENSLAFVVDSTNLTVDYSRNLIRHKVLPELSKINVNFASTINRNCDIILEDELFLDDIVSKKLEKISLEKSSLGQGYEIDQFILCPNNIRNRMIRFLLGKNNLPYDYKKIDLISKFILDATVKKFSVSSEKYFLKKDGVLILCDIERISEEEDRLNVDLDSDEAAKYLEYSLIKYEDIEPKVAQDKAILKRCIDFDKISGTPILRHKQDGDRIKLAYRHVSKSLKKLFCEEKLTAKERNDLLVISDDEGVIWAQNFGADERANVNTQTKNILFITTKK